MRVLICGGGIIGVSVAYFLGRRGIASTVIERCSLACAASGKGGGFLASDWCDGTPLERLATRSFDLHANLAEQFAGAWGYRRLQAYGGSGPVRTAEGRGSPDHAWLSDAVRLQGRLGSTATVAQVHPGEYTRALMAAATSAELRRGRITGIRRDGQGGRVTGVELEGDTSGGDVLEGDAVVIAMGPWSQFARQWLPLPAVYALKGHSLVFDTGDAIPPEALFLEYRHGAGDLSSPEVFPRPDGTTWFCAVSSETPLPVDPAAVVPDPGVAERLRHMAAAISPVLARSKLLVEQACYRPITPDGLPIIGPVPGAPGAYVATGHGPWGILNAPATGEAMTELIADGEARSVSLAPFDPGRFGRRQAS